MVHCVLWCYNSKHFAQPAPHTTLQLHPFNGFYSMTTRVSWHQKGKSFWILLEQKMMGWQWHQPDHIQIICTLLHTENHASTSSLSFYRPDALSAAQPTAGIAMVRRNYVTITQCISSKSLRMWKGKRSSYWISATTNRLFSESPAVIQTKRIMPLVYIRLVTFKVV